MRHGFQYRAIAEDKRWLHIRDDYYHFLRQHGERKYHGKEHAGYYDNAGRFVNRLPWELSVDHFVGTEACRFLRTYGDERPFAMMIGFPGPHCPYDPNAEFLEQIDPAQMPPAIPAAPGVTPKLRQANIDGNRQPWNGVDYTEFTAAHKQKIRAHYAASVLQIDYEVGQILEALAEQGLLDNTVIIFASDHGDYLGDHDLIGKGSYYESSIHVPLIVRLPGSAAAETYSGLVALGDIMPTIVGLAGCEIPPTLDFRLLPGLMQTDETARRRTHRPVGKRVDGVQWPVEAVQICIGGTSSLRLGQRPAGASQSHRRPRGGHCLQRTRHPSHPRGHACSESCQPRPAGVYTGSLR